MRHIPHLFVPPPWDDETIALAAEHLRDALESLGQVTGRTYHDELLDNIFSRFCIGK